MYNFNTFPQKFTEPKLHNLLTCQKTVNLAFFVQYLYIHIRLFNNPHKLTRANDYLNTDQKIISTSVFVIIKILN